MPPIVTSIIAIVQLAIKFAPEAENAYAEARDLFKMLFAAGLITVGQQKILMDWSDAHQAATLAGTVPPELQIDP